MFSALFQYRGPTKPGSALRAPGFPQVIDYQQLDWCSSQHPVSALGDNASVRFNCYPFTPADLTLLVWATTNLPAAAASIVTAENAATDDPSLRAANDAYIRDCIAAIARRCDSVERATDLFDFGISGEALDRLCEATEARRATIEAVDGPEPARATKSPQAGRKAAPAGKLWSG